MSRASNNPRLTIIGPDKHFGGPPGQECHDPTAIACFEKCVDILRPWRAVDLGDLREMLPFSRHGKTNMGYVDEYNWEEWENVPAKKHVDFMCSRVARYHAIEGNHDFWAERWCAEHEAGGRAVWDRIQSKRVLYSDYDPRDVRVVPYRNDRDITAHVRLAPNLIAIHGWSIAKHAAQAHLDKAVVAGCSVVYGHTHRIQMATTRHPFTDELFRGWSPGCLRSLRPSFSQAAGPTAWGQGFTMVYQSKTHPRDWTSYIIEVQNGRCILPDGSEVSV